MLTADEQPGRLYEQLSEDLGSRARKGGEAGAALRAVVERSGIALG